MGLFSDGFKELKKASEPLYKAPKSMQECRVRMGMTQEKLAEALITKKSTISAYEKDKIDIKVINTDCRQSPSLLCGIFLCKMSQNPVFMQISVCFSGIIEVSNKGRYFYL